MSAAPILEEGSQRRARRPLTRRRTPFGLEIIMFATGSALLAACATPPPPPPPRVVESVPYRPLPPGGAYYVMDIPRVGPDGRRFNINSNLSDDHLVWHLRSAWNVAALNCFAAEYAPILEGYRGFLKNQARPLKAVNERIEKEYARQYVTKREAMIARDAVTTQVYNFFASPPVRSGFCRAALDMANRGLAAPKTDPLTFARANFEGLLVPFEEFFVEYEAYERASAEWDAKWGTLFGASQPGWVAVQQARASGTIPRLGTLSEQNPNVQTVIDPETGLAVPVVPVNENITAQPVVQPIEATAQPRP
jgi:hypothetical protein